ncbi:YggT family protein [Candidatus Poribacteria bacterium]|nr:MAG: YggT family protein [Candidatus Poribacteria bacterium]
MITGAIVSLIQTLITVYIWILIADAILSWVAVASFNPTVRRLYGITTRLTSPILRPIRRAIWPITRRLGVDISPLIAVIILVTISRIIGRAF